MARLEDDFDAADLRPCPFFVATTQTIVRQGTGGKATIAVHVYGMRSARAYGIAG